MHIDYVDAFLEGPKWSIEVANSPLLNYTRIDVV